MTDPPDDTESDAFWVLATAFSIRPSSGIAPDAAQKAAFQAEWTAIYDKAVAAADAALNASMSRSEYDSDDGAVLAVAFACAVLACAVLASACAVLAFACTVLRSLVDRPRPARLL